MPQTNIASNSRLGAHVTTDGVELLLWAPKSRSIAVHMCGGDELVPMKPLAQGYHHATIPNMKAGTRYLYCLEDGRELPDPASRFQPEGVHGPSQVFDAKEFRWTDQSWKGRSLESSIFYELHVGTFTKEGTFDSLVEQLADLADLGITTIELMPVAQFPGSRNWGYDGVYPFAPQNSYGGPASLQKLVNAAHAKGLAVALDVVYNHLGPEGNYLNAFGPYFTDRYRTPWGDAINYDGSDSDGVRRFFIENALCWLEDFHFDALRLDAVHGIYDFGARHLLAELKSEVSTLSAKLGRDMQLIAESDLNDSRLLLPPEQGGYALDSQWSDDFHHSVHTLLTKEGRGYYSDFGGITPMIATLKDGWYYSGQYSVHRRRAHGNSPQGIKPSKFVVCSQNHDQVGNRAAGDRLASLVGFEALKVAAGVTLLSPFVPLLFMGEEYGEPAPFQYFTSHGDPNLVEAVRRGRRDEFATFGWHDSVPDPQDERTFERSHPNRSLKMKGPHQVLYHFYQELIRIRAELKLGSAASHNVRELGDSALLLAYHSDSQPAAMVFNFTEFPVTVTAPELAGRWKNILQSASTQWAGPQPSLPQEATFSAHCELRLFPYSFLVLKKVSSLSEVE